MPDQPYNLEELDTIPLEELDDYKKLQGAPAESGGERASRLAHSYGPILLGLLVLGILFAIGYSIYQRLHQVSTSYNKVVDESMLVLPDRRAPGLTGPEKNGNPGWGLISPIQGPAT